MMLMITRECCSRYLDDFLQLSIQLLKVVTTRLVVSCLLFPHLFHSRISVSGTEFLSTLIVRITRVHTTRCGPPDCGN